ncbi:AmmeMemoRadiSam system protein B [Azohydromonas caseinilytica]|uniref:MEMO1 family protein HHL10_27500 n=1 Tax=Azohydromonas caseinilytica TaxID=2728836 RepID=A0A848FK58_9BURK|nr:AmmeMemoRadiSam system protein B [Azohydromonas caseinilytica]NML18719.1 AmmeMemoRadiSam system protein B [Azohydromonas caseinilytica]
MPALRPAVVDGLFYPAAPAALREDIDALLAGARAPQPSRPPKLLIVPHAGYSYCGPVAAAAYALLQGLPAHGVRRVVVLSPAHRVPLRGLAAPTAQAFATPLGEVPVDQAALQALADLPQIRRDDHAHEHEHAIEVQLPFLQAVLDDFSLVPLVVGRAVADEVAQVLERLWGGPETLVLVSSDLSHYLRYEDAQALDRATVQRLLARDATLQPHEACGAAAINGALLMARRHGLSARLLDLRNSGDTAGDRERVVGYGALAFQEADA